MDEIDNVGRVSYCPVADGGIKAAKKISRKQGPGHDPANAPNRLMLSQFWEIGFQAEVVPAVRSNLTFFEGFCMKAVPVHSREVSWISRGAIINLRFA